ncbi:MAG TPA: N-6 DNA methylase [Candidatus Lokiarchaeia archaeon]|nr:N-6 DNA methylase [Candidatus Lokiarchaeia archaeon]
MAYRTKLIEKLKLSLPTDIVVLNSIFVDYNDENGQKKKEFDIVIAPQQSVQSNEDSCQIVGNCIAVIETKSPQSKTLGEDQAIKGKEILKAEVAFATNFSQINEIKENSVQEFAFEGTLDQRINQIAEYISNTIKNQIGLEEIHNFSLSDNRAIEILRECMGFIEKELEFVSPGTLEKATGLLWARKLDYTSYNDKKKSLELEHDARKAAAYILVDQIFFYHILSQQIPHYPPLNEIESADPEELDLYFKKVLINDYKAVFGLEITSFLPKTQKTVNALNQVIKIIKNSSIVNIKRDILGKIFHGLIPTEIRRHLAAFYTSNEAAALLANLVIDQWDLNVLDLACGSGTLLTEAYIRKKALAVDPDSAKTHRELLSQIYGNDVAIFAGHLATINLALQNSLAYTNNVNITIGDGFKISKTSLMKNIRELNPKGTNLDGEIDKPIEFKDIDVIFMNPPFTQHKRIDIKHKESITKIIKHETLGDFLDGRMGLHALFLLHCNNFLPIGGKLALVLPANTFTSNYGKKIMQFFKEKHYSIDYVIERVGSNNTFSEQCGLKEYLLVATKGLENYGETFTKLVSITAMPSLTEIPEFAQQLKKAQDSQDLSKYEVTLNVIPQDILLNSLNWNAFFQQNTTNTSTENAISSLLNDQAVFTRLVDYPGIIVRRGFDGTNIEPLSFPNKFWDIQEDLEEQGLRIKNRDNQKILFIPKKYLLKSFRLPQKYELIYYPGPKEYVLNIPVGDHLPEDLADYVIYMTIELQARRTREKKDGAARAKILDTQWYTHAHRQNCQKRIANLWIVWKFNIKTRRGFGFYSDEAGTAHNVFYQFVCENLVWEPLLAAWVNSSLWVYQLLKNSRPLTSQYHQLMIEDMNKNFLPNLENIDAISRENIVAAAKALDKIKAKSFRELFLGGYQRELDTYWLNALGISTEEVDLILNEIGEYFQTIFTRFEN